MNMNYREVKGDLIIMAKDGHFDVITHGCNCFCTMGSGIAPQMAKAFGCNNYPLEGSGYIGNINKLGCIDEGSNSDGSKLIVINSYTQYRYDAKTKPLDYEALTLCLRKIGQIYRGKRIGLPQIGCGLAGGDWEIVKTIIQKELSNCDITIVIFDK